MTRQAFHRPRKLDSLCPVLQYNVEIKTIATVLEAHADECAFFGRAAFRVVGFYSENKVARRVQDGLDGEAFDVVWAESEQVA